MLKLCKKMYHQKKKTPNILPLSSSSFYACSTALWQNTVLLHLMLANSDADNRAQPKLDPVF